MLPSQIDLSPIPLVGAGPASPANPNPSATPYVQSSALDPELKKVFEALILEIRRQCYVRSEFGGAGLPSGPAGGVSQADFDAFKASVIVDLNALRDSIITLNSNLDLDTGVVWDGFSDACNPPPLTTV